uniref:CS domain-containing protein n=1 Tax=Gouania willdenowi TaxID=441366 RepID=A0A8C5DJG0_GOUWI
MFLCSDFNAFLDQKGCSTDKHRWIPKQDKKKVACRYDWHQTGKNVVVTIYAKNANPERSSVNANQTVVSKYFFILQHEPMQQNFVIDVKKSSVYMVPSKLEITLCKADQVSWGKLEDPNYKPEPEPVENSFDETAEQFPPGWDIDDDDISDSDEEWAYDTADNRSKQEKKKERERKAEEELKEKRKEVEEEMKKAMEARKRVEEEKKNQEDQEGFEDMPDLEDKDED